MESVKNFFSSFIKPNEDDFFKSGNLTPIQFVQAGDMLTKTGWKWCSAVEGRKSKHLSDPAKQFLQVDARSEVRITGIGVQEENTNDSDKDEWVCANEKPSGEQETRFYTLTITYDEYYHCPRMWLSGVSEKGFPLTPDQIFEDVMDEYQNETVTVMEHPHLIEKQVSIHPCKHAHVMKSIVEHFKGIGKIIEPHQALFVFLKFMSSVIPTIQYDSAIDINTF